MDDDSISLNDLAKVSAWPARLLGVEPWGPRVKTPEEIEREYEREKWGELLREFNESGGAMTVGELEARRTRDFPDSVCFDSGELRSLPPMLAYDRQLEVLASLLKPLMPTPALVELGAGFGSMILGVAGREPFAGLPVIAGEYTASGVELIERLARNAGVEAAAHRCDFNTPDFAEMGIPAGSVIFTSFALCCVPELKRELFDALIDLRPKAVVHFEPIYEHADKETLLGLMQRRYIEVNDYNRNIGSLLDDLSAEGRIETLREDRSVFGGNPFLVGSMVAWKPAA